MHATEARKLAEANNPVSETVKRVFAAVKREASNGNTEAAFDMPTRSSDVKSELEKHGYKVVLHYDPRGGHDDHMTVSW